MLYGRDHELLVIGKLLEQCRAGRSGALVLRGDPGIGKTALLDHAAGLAAGGESGADGGGGGVARILRGGGAESEVELPFAGLHLLLRPVLDRVSDLPGPQRLALEGAFGLTSAPAAGDRLLVGLAVLSLLSDLAEDGPLLCLIDDAQWLDRESAQALLFAARRLDAEGVCLLFAARDGEPPFGAPGVEELRVAELEPSAAAALLARRASDLDPGVRYRILAEARGNPLALGELPAVLAAAAAERSPTQTVLLAQAVPLTGRVREAFTAQARNLPDRTMTLLHLLAADTTLELGVLIRAAEVCGVGIEDLEPAERIRLVTSGGSTGGTGTGTVAFRHPLVRAAIWDEAPLSARVAAHRALAHALDRPEDADRRAWHLAAAATGPDEQLAAELERTAVRAAERAGLAAAAAAYERSAALTDRAEEQLRRLTLAAEAAAEIGDLARARSLADRAEAAVRQGPPDAPADPLLRARLAQVLAAADLGRGELHSAHQLLLDGAELAAEADPLRAARMLLETLHPAWYLGDSELIATATRLLSVPLPDGDPMKPVTEYLESGIVVALGHPLDPLARLADVVPEARRAGFDTPHALIMLGTSAPALAQEADSHPLLAGVVEDCRAHGRAGWLASALSGLARTLVFLGRHRDAHAACTEAREIARAADQTQWISQIDGILAYLAAAAGDDELCAARAAASIGAHAPGTRLSGGASWAAWALGLLDLGRGRAQSALDRLEGFADGPARHQMPAVRCAADRVEAAVRLGATERAAEPVRRLSQWADTVRQPSVYALVQRCRALLAADDEAGAHYDAALACHAGDDRPFERARTELLYGEWLRRARRKTEARTRLRGAIDTFDLLGAAPWADRARAELAATGVAAPERKPVGVLASLTPQEAQIVRLAAQGLSNRDIAAQLFLSPRTVGHHLYKAYPKLGILSRAELPALVGAASAASQPT
ncbi:MAG TPA: AAA family ATPase [Actinocrinis sp.]|nr:AAA family ATPase [Actinocrinis sp.]